MAKRFTDTEKWKKSLLKSMPAVYKLLWLYVCDDCDHAGIWHVDLEVASMRIGEEIKKIDAEKYLKGKIVVFDGGEKWFIPGFIEFQYGELNPQNRAHQSVIKVLAKYKLSPLQGATEGAKDMDKEKDKDMDMDKEPSFPKKPNADNINLELPSLQIGSVKELMKISKQMDLSTDQVLSYWQIFKVQNFTGEKFYSDVGGVYSHFINWMKTQKIENGLKAIRGSKPTFTDKLREVDEWFPKSG